MKTLTLFLLICLSSIAFYGQEDCINDQPEETFPVVLPAINNGITEGTFNVPPIWNDVSPANETINIPNGRPIYALIVSGYANNGYLDEMMLYNFARHLQDQGAYVHYSWWNNLLAPYMERPLHHDQSYPGYFIADLHNFSTASSAADKALPGEDYQFVADAKILLTEIRENNPNAIIIVAGHSMGGGAIVHLAQETEELIDILAPIDPVGNRNLPWAGPLYNQTSYYNWTRWRVSRDGFSGFKNTVNVGTLFNPDCQPAGIWLESPPWNNPLDFGCVFDYFVHNAPTIEFGSNIINLHHRYQQEWIFPFDREDTRHFLHDQSAGGINSQSVVVTQVAGWDTGGWPLESLGQSSCCPSGQGLHYPFDGHGEIVGHRGNLIPPAPLGVRFKTSPECGFNCSGLNWPSRDVSWNNYWYIGDASLRKQRLIELETLPQGAVWPNEPFNPNLCLVSQGLIDLFDVMNKPPVADAGIDQIVFDTVPEGALVTLDGSSSTDTDGDPLTYIWTDYFDSNTIVVANTETPDVTLELGIHCIELQIQDPAGHIDIDRLIVEVVEATAINEVNAFDALSIFPNPNRGEFTIKLSSGSNEDIVVLVLDVRGRVVLSRSYVNTSNFDQVVDLRSTQPGMYFVKISDGEKQSIRKISVME